MKSQTELIHEYYQSGGKLTTIDALNIFKTTELRSLNCKIKKRYGIELQWKWINNDITGKKYKQFFLPEKQLDILKFKL